MFPQPDFSLKYTDRDKKIITFIIHSVLREYSERLKPFTLFGGSKLKSCKVSPDDFIKGLGFCHYHTDHIDLEIPTHLGMWDITAHSSLIAHEIAHHAIDEYFEGYSVDHRRLGTNLVHYAANIQGTNPYLYSKRYGGPLFWKRYGYPYAHLQLYDVRKLIDARDYIMSQGVHIVKGVHEYW